MYAVLDNEEINLRAEERGLDRAALAQAAGISVDTLKRIQRGERVMFGTAQKVARVFGVRARELRA